LEKAILAPGDSTFVEVIFDTRSYFGLITKRPRITCEGITPNHFVSITANVSSSPDSTQPLVIRPYALNLSPDSTHTPDTCLFSLINVSPVTQQMSVSAGCPELFSHTFPRSIGPSDTFQCTLRLTDLGKTTYFHKSFTIQAASTDSTRFTIPVFRNAPPILPVATVPDVDCR
jgi:hypothetical protein